MCKSEVQVAKVTDSLRPSARTPLYQKHTTVQSQYGLLNRDGQIVTYFIFEIAKFACSAFANTNRILSSSKLPEKSRCRVGSYDLAKLTEDGLLLCIKYEDAEKRSQSLLGAYIRMAKVWFRGR